MARAPPVHPTRDHPGAVTLPVGRAGRRSRRAGRRDGPTLRDIGEDDLVRAVLARYGPPPAALLVGPGDDAAVIEAPGRIAVSTDTLVEGADFVRDWSSARESASSWPHRTWRTSPPWAPGRLALVVSLAAPPQLELAWATGLADGLDDECSRAGATVAGGDVSQAAQVVLTGTALGCSDGHVLLRSGARAGDVLALAGRTGPSAAGLRAAHGGGPPSGRGGPDRRRRGAGAGACRPPAPVPGRPAGRRGRRDRHDRHERRPAPRRRPPRCGLGRAARPRPRSPRAAGRPRGRRAGPGPRQRRARVGAHRRRGPCPARRISPGRRRARAVRGRGAGPRRRCVGPGVVVAGAPWAGPDGWHHFTG